MPTVNWQSAIGNCQLPHLLSFDVEEYFHVEAARIPRADWPSYASRLDAPVDRICSLLTDRGSRATFFVLGWVARSNPSLVRRIAGAGFEIASHGMTHEMICRLDRRQFRAELTDSRKLLEDIAGAPVVGYRAPTFSVVASTTWALDELAETGYRYDSSVFPVRHDRYGIPGAPTRPHVAVGPGGGRVLEFPPLTLRCLGANLPVGGGGYLRLLPVGLVGRALRAAEHRGQPGTLYLHPWEFDPDQPDLPMPARSRWRHRVGLRRTERKLLWLLERFRFDQIGSWAAAQAAAQLPEHHYPLAGP